MSDRATTWAWQQDVESDKARLTLLLIANCADLNGEVSASRKEWAALLRCSVDTFDRRVRALVAEDLLKVEKTKTRHGFGASIYRLKIPAEFGIAPGRNSAATPKTAASRKPAYSPPETTEEIGEAAELRLAAPAAASIKNLNTEPYPEPIEVVVAGAPTATWTICAECRAIADEFGFLNGTGEAVYREMRQWYADNGISKRKWAAPFRKWCAKEDPNRDDHSTHQTDAGAHAPGRNRTGLARRTETVGGRGGGGGLVGAALRSRARRRGDAGPSHQGSLLPGRLEEDAERVVVVSVD